MVYVGECEAKLVATADSSRSSERSEGNRSLSDDDSGARETRKISQQREAARAANKATRRIHHILAREGWGMVSVVFSSVFFTPGSLKQVQRSDKV